MTPQMNEVSKTNRAEREGTVRAALAAQGIESLDDLISRLGSKPSLLESEDRLLVVRAARAEAAMPRPHRPPKAGFIIDGHEREPESIRDYDGAALHSAPGFNSRGEIVLFSFTALEGLQEYLASPADVRPLHDIGTTNPDSLPSVASYFQHDDNQGDRLQNNPGRAWRNLTRLSRGFLGLADWNDIISSVDWYRWDISLYEHVDYQGSSLYLRAGRTYQHLSDFGWNDRASSTVNWGTRS